MHRYLILIAFTGLAGCATAQPPAVTTAPEPPQPIVREAPPVHTVETGYYVRSYRDGDDPSLLHAAHVVYRETLVPARVASLEVSPRSVFPPVTYDPLPPNAELAAELAEQKEITAELRTIQATMETTEKQAEFQYSTLADQTAASIKLRRDLEADRTRLREMEEKLRAEQTRESEAPPAAPASSSPW